MYRRNNDKLEILLVQATHNPNEWVLPKGHIEPEETLSQAAVREVKEESNVWAKVLADLGDVNFNLSEDSPVRMKVFLMECVEEKNKEARREKMWLITDEAINKASHEETKRIMSSGVEQLRQYPPDKTLKAPALELK